MAKIGKIDYLLDGKHCTAEVKCDSKGVFKTYLPEKVTDELNIGPEVKGDSLNIVKQLFSKKIMEYADRTIEEEHLLLVKFGAKGSFTETEDGVLFNHRSDFYIEDSWSKHPDSIAFMYQAIIRRKVNGIIRYYKAFTKDGAVCAGMEISSNQHKSAKFLPYSKEAEESLNKINAAFKNLTKQLYNLVNQPEEDILKFLEVSTIKLLA